MHHPHQKPTKNPPRTHLSSTRLQKAALAQPPRLHDRKGNGGADGEHNSAHQVTQWGEVLARAHDARVEEGGEEAAHDRLREGAAEAGLSEQ